ncbi:serine-rich adhesin for platelets isoform X1 [Parasteatoda tepidariorum]|uniref:serine-rich adhesin for platelets isoform X1 n=1 Tax=Parasteatoda tepidariorum TaxID=114398 RepID=UPI001C719138|nr:mucin-5AC isoform X1 [Parasteatoda tepidariorum]
MTRIILLKFWLIFAWSGIAICSTDDSITTDIPEISSSTLKENPLTEPTVPSGLESSTTTHKDIEQNKGNIDKVFSENASSSQPMAPSSFATEKEIKDTSNAPSTGSDTSTATAHETKFSSSLRTSPSDIDYGGYFVTNTNDSKPEIATSELQKAGLQKSLDEEYIPLKSNEIEVAEGNSQSENLHTASVNVIDFGSDTNLNESIAEASLATVDFADVEKSASVSNEQRVSASPKSATIKRSLNSTADAVRGFASSATFTPVSSDTTASFFSPSSKVDGFDTTIKIEELPTPLPIEIYNSQGVTHLTSVKSAETTFGDLSEASERVDSLENAPSLTVSPNSSNGIPMKTLSTSEYTDDKLETNVSLNDNDDRTESNVLGDLLFGNGAKTPKLQTQPNGVFEHENDDIIYAGFADEEPAGVTFDPDGLKNDFSQDPDSIIFSVPPQIKKQSPTEANIATEREKEPTKSFNSEHLPHDAPETEFEHLTIVNASNDEPKETNHSDVLVPPAVIFGRPIHYSSEEMLQDDNSVYNGSFVDVYKATAQPELESKTAPKEILSHLVNSTESKPGTTLSSHSNELREMNEDIAHNTEQSVLRPIKIKSPSEEPTSTQVTTLTSSTHPTEFTIGNNPLNTTDSKESQSATTNLSSPIILPNPAPSTTEKLVGNLEISTAVVQPELVDSLFNKSLHPLDNNENGTLSSDNNSTIAGLAIKTSVSVTLPISIKQNSSLDASNSDADFNLKTGDSSATSLFNESRSSSESTSVPTTLVPSTSTTSVKIRRPSIRVPGRTDGPALRTRKPFMAPKPQSSSTAGPPVSIFKKERTRSNSITSSTTSTPFPQFSTIRVHYASRYPGMKPEEFSVSVEPITVPPTTTTEEPISEVPFTDTTFVPTLSREDDVMLVKVGGGITLERGLRWSDQLSNRHSPEFKEKATQIHLHLENLFRSSPIAPRLWRIQIDGFNGTKNSRSVEVDFILYLIKSPEKIAVEHLARVFHEKLSTNNTFARYRVDPNRTAFEMLQEEPLRQPTPSPEDQYEPPVPQWAIAVIVICAASLIFIVLFAAVTMYGRHHMRRRYGNKLNEEDLDRSSGEWESKMTAAYENMAADTIYEAEDLRGDTYKKQNRIATFHGIPSTLKRCDSWSSGGWSTPPRRKKPPHVH